MSKEWDAIEKLMKDAGFGHFLIVAEDSNNLVPFSYPGLDKAQIRDLLVAVAVDMTREIEIEQKIAYPAGFNLEGVH
jgi:hypothetical protein